MITVSPGGLEPRPIRLIRNGKRWIESVLFHLIAALMMALVAVVTIQVFSRYVMNASVPWTEEISRLLLVWSTLLGAGLASFQGLHLRMDLFADRVGSTVAIMLATILATATLYFLWILFVGNLEVIEVRDSIPFTSFPSISSKYLSHAIGAGCLLMMAGTAVSFVLIVWQARSGRRIT